MIISRRNVSLNHDQKGEFKEHSDLIIEKLFEKLIDTDDTFINKIYGG